jgi:hypothetical protein
MSTLTAPRPSKTGVGKPTPLATYSIPGEDRVLIGQRVEGVVRITDQSADGAGRRYLVDRGLEEDGRAAVEALVADYLTQAAKYSRIPIAHVPLDAYLETLPWR